jgi:hypothetical protein
MRGLRGSARKASGWDGVGPSRLAAGISRLEQEREVGILLPLLRWPDWLEGHEEELAQLQFRDPKLEQLRQEIVAWFVDGGNLDAAALQRHLTRYGFGPLLDQFAADLTPPTAPADASGDAEHRRGWRDMLAAIRHRAALQQERPTEDDLRHGNGAQVNRLFYRLDRLLNRDGADDTDSGDGPPNTAG